MNISAWVYDEQRAPDRGGSAIILVASALPFQRGFQAMLAIDGQVISLCEHESLRGAWKACEQAYRRALLMRPELT